ncbi:Hypp5499 [Branchiostoma lanceolatum]|uniref:Hypp5499 protein n=1 Tax=Branchiostoma lanceolatum TaxID=7740 RepID=A0A8J9YMS3_BRALA|nr:Hypp5499 [Branchiostoma lanceolatum]
MKMNSCGGCCDLKRGTLISGTFTLLVAGAYFAVDFLQYMGLVEQKQVVSSADTKTQKVLDDSLITVYVELAAHGLVVLGSCLLFVGVCTLKKWPMYPWIFAVIVEILAEISAQIAMYILHWNQGITAYQFSPLSLTKDLWAGYLISYAVRGLLIFFKIWAILCVIYFIKEMSSSKGGGPGWASYQDYVQSGYNWGDVVDNLYPSTLWEDELRESETNPYVGGKTSKERRTAYQQQTSYEDYDRRPNTRSASPEEADDMRPPLGGEAPTREDYNRSLRRKSSQAMRDDPEIVREEPSAFATAPRSPSEVYSPFHDFSAPADDNETAPRYPQEDDYPQSVASSVRGARRARYPSDGYSTVSYDPVARPYRPPQQSRAPTSLPYIPPADYPPFDRPSFITDSYDSRKPGEYGQQGLSRAQPPPSRF